MSSEPLDLASARWRELQQAFGSAEDIPRLLGALYEVDDEGQRAELWYGAWATLCPADRAYSASYAAVPHLLAIITARDFAEHVAALHLVAQIEISRHAVDAPPVDEDLVVAYATAIESLPARVAETLVLTWDPGSAQVLAAAMLAGKRQHALARAVLELGNSGADA